MHATMATARKTTTSRTKAPAKVLTPLDIQMAQLQLANKMLDFPTEHQALKDTAQALIDSAELGVQEAQLAHKSQIEALEANYNAKKLELEEKLEEDKTVLNEALIEKQAELDNLFELIEKQKQINAKDLENLMYEHKLAVRDEKYSTAVSIAGVQGKVIVDKDGYNEIVEKAVINEQAMEDLEKKVKEAESVRNGLSSKYSALKSEYEQYQAVSEVKLNSLTTQTLKDSKRIEELEAQLALVPAQIATAVDKAKANVNVTNETRK